MTPERWQRIKAIFYRAVECDPAARAEFLSENCGDDQELRKEVESLLASYHDPGTLFDNPLVGAGAMAAASSGAALVGLPGPSGMLPERYEILEELGRGGMGIVYKARDGETGEVLALKILKPEIAADLEIIERFKNELRLAHRITHPNVARLYEFHRAGETLYLSMEYVEGESLRTLLNRTGKLDLATGLDMARKLAAGIAEAHRQAIAHRDLKPENIMIAAGGDLKILDFGISRSYAANVSVTGRVIGTPAYMAPEQAAGKPADHRTDIYAMGLILFEMFTGRAVFSGETPVELALKHVQERPTLPRTLAPELPTHVENAILKCLEKDPADRFQSVEELVRVLDGTADFTAGTKWYRRVNRRGIVAGVAGLAIVLTVSAILWPGGGRNLRPAPEKPSIAVLPFVDRSPEKNQEYFSDGMAEQVVNSLARVEGLRVVGRTSSFRFKGTTEDSRAIGKKLNVTTILEGSLSKQGNRARINVQLIKVSDGFNLWSNTYDREMSDIFDVQDSIARAVTEALKVTLLGKKGSDSPTMSTSAEAYNAYLQGRYFLRRNDKESMERAVGYFEQAIKADRRYAPSWVGIAEAHANQANLGDRPTEEGYRMARQELETALVLGPNLGEAYSALGRLKMLHDWDWAGADAAYQRALSLSPGASNVISQSGNLARIRGHFDEAVALGRRAIEIDPLVAGAYHNAGLAFHYAGLHREAIGAFRKALELVPDRAITHSMLAAVYLVNRQPREALVEARLEKNAVLKLWGITLAYYALGQKRESDASLAELIASFPGDAPFSIAEVYAFRGETDRAFEWLDRAYAERDSGLTLIKGNPLLTRLEPDPRYAALLKKLRLA